MNNHLGKGLYIGQVVSFSKELFRVGRGMHREWQERDIPENLGLVMGLRTLQTGYIGNDDWGAGNYWSGVPNVPCVLVVVDIYKNPVRVPYAHVMDMIRKEDELWNGVVKVDDGPKNEVCEVDSGSSEALSTTETVGSSSLSG